jgi:hypothetical protein
LTPQWTRSTVEDVVAPDELDTGLTLRTAVARFESLRAREALAGSASDPEADGEPLSRAHVLELLALGEVIARKVGYGRQLTVRSAREAGCSWTEIGRALGTTKQAAWEAHTRWIRDQSEQHRRTGYSGLDELQAARARRLAGRGDDEPGG